MPRRGPRRRRSRIFGRWPSVSSLRPRTTTTIIITTTTTMEVNKSSTSWDPTVPMMDPLSAWVSSPTMNVPSLPTPTTVPPPTPPSPTEHPCPTPPPPWSAPSACPARNPKMLTRTTTTTNKMPMRSRRVANNSTRHLPSVRLASPDLSSTPITVGVTLCRGSRSFVRMEMCTRLDLPRIRLLPSLLVCLVLDLFFWRGIRTTLRPSWSVPRLIFPSKFVFLGALFWGEV
mmetsp:Transcript_31534/g.53802  ORF Transcript_31534/g.53802 Transcript_31534/m.53802 type:complete len:230 (-) Transcript_31534:147-836(-)